MNQPTDDTTRGFRPSARRRNRIAAGVALGAAAIGANVFIYAAVDDTKTALQAVDNIPAGTQVTADMFRVVDVDVDDSVPTVSAEQLPLLIGQYTRVRIVSGSLVVGVTFQGQALVERGKAVVAIEIDQDLVPIGVRERSNLQLVTVDDDDVPQSVPGRSLAPPTPSASGAGTVSISVEVDAAQAAGLAAADEVKIVLLPPEADPAAGDPAAGDPAAGDPAAGDPAAGDPAAAQGPERDE